jgi:hypothetical protein
MDGETIDKNFAKAFKDIVNKYDNAAEEEPAYQELSLNQCIAMARSLLTEPCISNYHTMKTHVLAKIKLKNPATNSTCKGQY